MLEDTEAAIADVKAQRTTTLERIRTLVQETMMRLEEEAIEEVNTHCETALADLQTAKTKLEDQKEKVHTCADSLQTILKGESPIDIVKTSLKPPTTGIAQKDEHPTLPTFNIKAQKTSTAIDLKSFVTITCSNNTASAVRTKG